MAPFEPKLIEAWMIARSLARGLPPPRWDRGGLRLDTGSEKEVRRWVFPEPHPGLGQLGREIDAPRIFLKLCGSPEALRQVLPGRWVIQPLSYVMVGAADPLATFSAPEGYRLERSANGEVGYACLLAPDGTRAASGYCAEAEGVFIYDRIETEAAHRRRGLGQAIMHALGALQRSPDAIHVLVATEAGKALYTRLGWSVISPYATAVIPG